MWVLTKEKSSWVGDSDTYTTKYAYTTNGLVKVINYSGEKTTYTYDKKNRLKSNVAKYGKTTWKTTYKLDGKGRVVKATTKGSSSSGQTFTYNAKGQLTKHKGFLGWTKYSYNSKGQVKKTTEDNAETGKNTYSYKYDEQGNVVKRYNGKRLEYHYVNTYKNGNMVKSVGYTGNSNEKEFTETYTYKQIKVPKSLAKYVKAQQRILVSSNLDYLEAAHK
ncbi:MAG: hypothetical protein Q4D27_01260 [Coriobacteriia bacterium]|nr:hypothetical protein [Coriobacteriia bacterium]